MRERIKDWGQGFCRTLGKRMVELTGDYTPDMVSLLRTCMGQLASDNRGGSGAGRPPALPNSWAALRHHST